MENARVREETAAQPSRSRAQRTRNMDGFHNCSACYMTTITTIPNSCGPVMAQFNFEWEHGPKLIGKYVEQEWNNASKANRN